ncbi:MAG: ATP-binding cassette domain-containing protein [Crocinitomicaceae bacterium]|nr:ATP-binding cassette domain-containing protein [Crocinitomicaceae bacterium]
MLKVHNVSLIHDDLVLNDVSFEFKDSEIYGIVGRSGAGKTSFLKVASAFQDSNSGFVEFEGEKLIGPSQKLIPGYDDIQLVNQDFALEPYHSVEENVKEKVLSRHKDIQEELVTEYLELVELDDIRTRKARFLSGGEQQRLAIARALANEPKVLMLDEPFVHLDQRLKYKIITYLKHLNEIQGVILIIVSHDGSELMGFVNQILYFNNGQVERKSRVKEFYYAPRNVNEAELMGPINSIQVNGENLLFRPNQYELIEDDGINLKFIRSIDTGLVVFNYFMTNNLEEVMLTSNESMENVSRIKIRKIC